MEMSKILLYVEEELSCSVTLEEEDLTVESFWKNVLNEVSRQPTILDFASGQSIRQKVKSDAYSAARARKVKVFSESEIEGSTGLQKIYQTLWNEKAEEICSNSNLTTFKPGEIQGAINVAWTLEKTQHLKEDMEKLQEETGQSCIFSNVVLKKFQSSNQTFEKNSERLESAHTMLSKTQDTLKKERFELFKCSNGGQHKIVVDNIEKQGTN